MASALFLHPEFNSKSLAKAYVEKYIKTATKFLKIEEKSFKNFSINNPDQKRKKEADLIFKSIDEKDFLILFDEKGKTFSSREFAKKISDKVKRVVYVVGGPYGFDQSLIDRADLKVSLSKLTMNSEIATVMASEQIFRIHSINAGHPYHND